MTKIVKKSFVLRNSNTKGDLWENTLISAKKSDNVSKTNMQ